MTATVQAKEPIKVLAEILQAEMGMAEGQLMLGLENWKIPPNTGLYIALFYGNEEVVGSNNDFDPESNTEIQSVAMLHTVSIEAMSFDSSARLRKEEILMALNSMRAENVLSDNLMRIGQLPQGFLPIPELEETKQLNKYRITFAMNALHQKVKPADYYDKFPAPKVIFDA